MFGRQWWQIEKDGKLIVFYGTESEAIEQVGSGLRKKRVYSSNPRVRTWIKEKRREAKHGKYLSEREQEAIR